MDVNGNIVSWVEPDPWGAYTNRYSNGSFQPREFTSYERDANRSDEAMFRRYNRWHSRFDQPDPYDGSYSLTDPQSFNRYAYTQNDPVNFTDPSGLLNWPLPMGPPPSTVTIPISFDSPISNLPPGMMASLIGSGMRRPNPINDAGPPETTQNPTPAPTSQDRLPFNSCEQFVNWLSDLATGVLIQAHLSGAPHNSTAKSFGASLINIAYFGYESHIHNGDAGFKSELVDAGKGSPEGRQGSGVYGHIFFGAGATLYGRADPVGWAAYHANRLKDWAQGNSQYSSERAGNIAGKAVGNYLWDYLRGKGSQADLSNQLKGILCN
ncbi:MAG: RHS repeat domain-containing protein [Pyrinomonadaceae bacterium]